jgi:hypothetical protein
MGAQMKTRMKKLNKNHAYNAIYQQRRVALLLENMVSSFGDAVINDEPIDGADAVDAIVDLLKVIMEG